MRSGLFAESPEETEAFLAGIVEALAARDDVEAAQAEVVARHYP